MLFRLFSSLFSSEPKRMAVKRVERLRIYFRESGVLTTTDSHLRDRNEIKTIKSPTVQGFGQEATFFLGRGKDGYYHATTVTPDRDMPVEWRGPIKDREVAEAALRRSYERWNDANGDKEERHYEARVEEFERQGCPEDVRDKETGERYQACPLPRRGHDDDREM